MESFELTRDTRSSNSIPDPYSLNYYQSEGVLSGENVSGADNHDVTHWGLGHGGIDNDTRVMDAIEGEVKAKIQP